MKNLILGTLIDAVRAGTQRERERTKIAQWTRQNATVQRALPPLPDDDATEIGLLYAIGQGDENGTGVPPGEPTPATPASGTVGGQASQATTGEAGRPDAGGQNSSGGQTTQPPGSASPPPAGQGGNSRRAGLPAWAWAAIAASGVIGAGGVGYLMAPKDETTVIKEGDQSLYQWLEDSGYHLPPDE